jgi:hypothetical protein
MAMTTPWAIAFMLAVADGEPDRAPKHAVSLRPLTTIQSFGLDMGYERSLGRRFTVGGRFTYVFPRVGYGHLQGMEETVLARIWVPRPLHGFYAEASFGVAHQVLVATPRLSRTAIVPGLSAGARWQFGHGLLLGASVGLRWGHQVGGTNLICTASARCAAVRSGAYPHLAAEIGYAF